MNTERRASYWEDWQSRINGLYNEVWDALSMDFAPYRFYKNGTHVPEDKDTAAVKELYDMLERMNEYVEEHAREVYAARTAMYDAWDMFRAWEAGLCPRVMRSYRDAPVRRLNDAGDIETWPEIAEYLRSGELNEEDTMQAVLAWKMSRQEAK